MPNRFSAFAWLAICVAPVLSGATVTAQRTSGSSPLVTAVYVSAVDRKNAPVTDLTTKDFVLREGGRVREIVKVEPATALMHIAVIVDDSGTGIFRYGVATFVDQLLGHAQFAIRRVVGQVQTLVNYTTNVEQLRSAVLNLKVMPETPEGGQIVEGIFEAARELQAGDVRRPVIVVLTDTEAEYSSLQASHVLQELQRSGAVLYVISVAKMPSVRANLPAPPVLPGSAPLVDKPSDLLDRQIDINRVLGDGPKQSGGRRAEIAAAAGPIPALQEIADELNHQYLVTYIVPGGEKVDQKISVSTKRAGVTLRAPSRAGRRDF